MDLTVVGQGLKLWALVGLLPLCLPPLLWRARVEGWPRATLDFARNETAWEVRSGWLGTASASVRVFARPEADHANATQLAQVDWPAAPWVLRFATRAQVEAWVADVRSRGCVLGWLEPLPSAIDEHDGLVLPIAHEALPDVRGWWAATALALVGFALLCVQDIAPWTKRHLDHCRGRHRVPAAPIDIPLRRIAARDDL